MISYVIKHYILKSKIHNLKIDRFLSVNKKKPCNMNSQPYAMIHRDPTCQTLNEAIRKMNAIPNPIFCYKHTVYANNTNSDLSFASYIVHDVANEIITLRFPPECKWIANLKNNHHCKMVTYYKDGMSNLGNGTYLKELTITPHVNIDTRAHQEATIRIYTRGIANLEIYFDMYLVKPIHCKL